MSRSLSALEAKLILKLEWDKQPLVTIPQAMTILGISHAHARQVLHRLARDGWLAPVVPGTYELIPAERGELGFSDPNPLLIGSCLVAPYYFSYSTAAYHYGLTTQAPATVYIATSHGKTQRRLVRDHEYQLVYQSAALFFGAVEVEAYGLRVKMADPEKTVLDALDRPVYAGGLPEAAGMLVRGRSQLNWDKLVDDALRFQSRSLAQRLGYLCDRLQAPWRPAARERLLAQVGQSKIYLGANRRWPQALAGRHTNAHYNSTWQVVDNIPPAELTADLEIR